MTHFRCYLIDTLVLLSSELHASGRLSQSGDVLIEILLTQIDEDAKFVRKMIYGVGFAKRIPILLGSVHFCRTFWDMDSHFANGSFCGCCICDEDSKS